MKQVITKNYKWQYETCGRDNEIGIISREGFQQRVLAIASGEYKRANYEPTTWHFHWEEGGGAVPDKLPEGYTYE